MNENILNDSRFVPGPESPAWQSAMGDADQHAEATLDEALYRRFLLKKLQHGAETGFEPLWMPDILFDFQKSATEFSIRRGRSALFLDCGMGKSACELVWGENISRKAGKRVLLLTPLAVCDQMVNEEAAKFGVEALRSKDGKLPPSRIVVSNYERLHYFNPEDFSGVICDESSAIKNFNGQRRAQVTEFMRTVPYRLLSTATAAPNDYTELGTSSEALGELGHVDMLNRFFKNDQNTSDTRMMKRNPISQGGPKSAGWRFKGHAEIPFWRYVCGWARAGRKPSDLDPRFSDARFVLPDLIEQEHVVQTRTLAEGMLFAVPASNRREELEERRRTIQERCEKAAELVVGTGKPSMIWCHLNPEGDLLEKLIPDGRQISGSMDDDEKEEVYTAFRRRQLKDLIIKDKIGAWGLNCQFCDHVVRFATHSYEAHYQAVRRCYRFGQKNPVTVDLIVTEGEQGIKENLHRKAINADRMFTELVKNMHSAIKLEHGTYEKKVELPTWA
jgi:hypothetical protein